MYLFAGSPPRGEWPFNIVLFGYQKHCGSGRVGRGEAGGTGTACGAAGL